MFIKEITLGNVINSAMQGGQIKTPLDYTYEIGFRTKPRVGQIYKEVDQSVADPLMWFLSNDSLSKMTKLGVKYEPDRGHPWYFEKHSLRGYDSWAVRPYSPTSIYLYPFTNCFTGMSSNRPTSVFTTNGSTREAPNWADDLASFGQQAINKTKPKPYVFDASAFIAELQQGLPKLAGLSLLKANAQSFLKHSGDEYLNIQFGWKPFLSDLSNMLKSLIGIDETLHKLAEQQGKPKHRSYSLGTKYYYDERRTTIGSGELVDGFSGFRRFATNPDSDLYSQLTSRGIGASAGQKFSTNGPTYTLRTCATQRWFEGSFTSFFNYPLNTDSYVSKALSLMNLKGLTPEVLWEIAPWSWMIDWVFHIQDTLGSVTMASDQSVVMTYGYVMEKTDYRMIHMTFLEDVSYQTYFTTPGKHIITVATDSYRRRIRANPFGFQVSSFSGLSAEQLAILAALGFSRR